MFDLTWHPIVVNGTLTFVMACVSSHALRTSTVDSVRSQTDTEVILFSRQHGVFTVRSKERDCTERGVWHAS